MKEGVYTLFQALRRFEYNPRRAPSQVRPMKSGVSGIPTLDAGGRSWAACADRCWGGRSARRRPRPTARTAAGPSGIGPQGRVPACSDPVKACC
jgi:hypothetical protein